jgi:hypothetical protein
VSVWSFCGRSVIVFMSVSSTALRVICGFRVERLADQAVSCQHDLAVLTEQRADPRLAAAEIPMLPPHYDLITGLRFVPPARSPNLNSHLERFHLSLKAECLDKMIFFGERSLRNAVGQFRSHFHSERNHQGLDNNIIEPQEEVGLSCGDIQCRERLGGLLRYYCRSAA